MKRVVFGSIAAALLLSACPPTPMPPTPDADSGQPIADATPPPPPVPTDACGRGEAKLLELGCKDSRGRLLGGSNLHGQPWAVVCRENAAHGVDMRPDCMSGAKSCAEVDRCR